MGCRVFNLILGEFFIKPMAIGLVSLLCFSSKPSKFFDWAVGFLGSLPHSPIYHLLLIFSIFILGCRVWSLCREVGEIREIQDNLRSGCCSKCGGSELSNKNRDGVGGLLLSNEVNVNEGDVEEEEVECINGVCCNACASKMQSFKGLVCGEVVSDDVIKLRKELEKEKKLRGLTESELEKERRAASSAAEETIAKIFSIQNEKGLIEREFRQYREMAEQKKVYDQEVIEELKWLVLKFRESRGTENSVLVDSNFGW